ncbi:MAG: DNA polymerase III subunit beta [Planctomycetales bacterium]|nr:DNA polymerase III subunit beta [Planctomycetales bacterium]
MKITCDREKLLEAFQTVAAVVPSRSPKPILQNVKLIAAKDGAMLMATDMEVGIRMDVAGIDVDVEGRALLPVQRFGSILRESTDDKLVIEADPQGTVVRGERSEFKLPGGNPDEFPDVEAFSDKNYHEAPARLFRELIRRTLFATDTESSRYALGGVLLEFGDDQLTAVGTDGRRLAKMQGPAMKVGAGSSTETMTIVPSRAMQLMERSLTDGDAEIQIAAHGSDIQVKSPRATIYARLVEGRFPKWRDVFPSRTQTNKIELTVGPVFAAVRQASIVASEESRGLLLTFADGTLTLAGQTAEVGQSRVELPIAYDGEPLVISLDHRFVADFFKVLDPEKTFTLDVQDGDAAAVFSTEDGYGYVVMPLARDGRR